jgi:hypothetical protein
VVDANYRILKMDIEKSRILEEIFSEKFELKMNYKPEKLLDFTEVKEALIRNFPNVERGVSLMLRHFGQSDMLSSILLRDTMKTESQAFDKFINTIKFRINEQIDDFNQKVLNEKKFQNKKDEIPEELNFKAHRRRIKEKIISYSNDIIRAFAGTSRATRPGKMKNEREFISVSEKIIRLYNFLKCDESVITHHTALSSGLLLHSICCNHPRPMLEYVTFNTQELKANLNKDAEKMYPIFMSKREIVIRRLHDIIKDNDEITDIDYDYVARSVFFRDQSKLFRQIYTRIEKAMAELKIEGLDEFLVRNEDLKANIDRSKLQIEQIITNEFFVGIKNGRLTPEAIRLLQFNEDSMRVLVGLEKFVIDLQKVTIQMKNLMEQVLFFRQEEELFYKTKFFKVLRYIIEVLNSEREKYSLEHLVEGLFKKLKKTIEDQDRVEDEDEEIESKLMEQLLQGKHNVFLKNTYVQMQEDELRRKRGEHKIKEDERKYNRKAYENQIKKLLDEYDSDKEKKHRKSKKGILSSSDSENEKKKEKQRKDELQKLLEETKRK